MKMLALGLMLLAGCAAVPAPDTSEPIRPREVIIGLGQTGQVGGVAVRPIAVLEDSRCPSDVTCIWAGRLRLRTAIGGAEAELTLGEPHALPRGGTLTLTSARPAPVHRPPPGAESGPANRFGFRTD